MSSEPKTYIALDIGNVLVHADFKPFLDKLSRTLNITLEEATYFMNRTQKLHDLGYTVMSDELRDHFKIRSSVLIEDLVTAWTDIIQPNYTILDRLDDMSQLYNLQIALLSNVGLEHAEKMSEILNHKQIFSNATKHFSCQVGARKPTLLYYHTFLQLHPEWQGCLYIDDLKENLETSKQFGFRTYHFALDTKHDALTLLDALDDIQIIISDDYQIAKNLG